MMMLEEVGSTDYLVSTVTSSVYSHLLS